MAKPPRPDIETLRAILRESGLRATASRIAVLDLLRRSSSPVSHAEVAASLADRSFDRTTLYRNLVDLERAGLVRRTELGDRVWRFEDAQAGHTSRDHPHFVCTECGRIVCLPGTEITVPARSDSPQAIRERVFEVQIRGSCDDCTGG